MKIFVTGGAGYVGSHCVKELRQAGYEILVYDNLSSGHREAAPPSVPFIQGDLGDESLLTGALLDNGFDAVMHFAASLDVGESVRHPLKYYENNVTNTIHLLRIMHQAGIRKLIFSSTCATYGTPAALPIREDMPQQPISPYGRSKLAIEWALQDCAVAWGLGSMALRYFNAAGAAADGSIGEDHDPEIHLIPIILQVALGQRDKIKIFGTDYPTPDGTCIRDYIHVEDLAVAHRLALEALEPGTTNHFTVGTGVGTSVRQVIEAARGVTGKTIPAEETDRRPGDPPELFADPARLRQTLGWEPRYTEIEKTIETAWKWHADHPNGYETK